VAGYFEYRMVIRSDRTANARALSAMLGRVETVEFRLSPAGDGTGLSPSGRFDVRSPHGNPAIAEIRT
jgi:hypothetical protein